ncbi:MAG: metallopeptidase TldD-related protein [Candidatus Coatesbacteria bacterium]
MRAFAGFLAAAMLLAGGVRAAEAPDPIVRALEPELSRNLAKLLLPDQPRPYWFAFSGMAMENLEIGGRLGDIVQDDLSRLHYLQARIRVGSTIMDNTNFIGYGDGGSVRMTTGDDTPGPVVRDAWLAADGAYKNAVGTLAAKEAALKRETQEDRAPDFSPAEPAEVWEEPATLSDADRGVLRDHARALSAVFRAFPAIQRGDIRINARAATFRFVDTEGFRFRASQRAVRILVTANTQATDGTPLQDAVSVMAPTAPALPSAASLAGTARALAERLSRRVTAEGLKDPYLGPVLFTAPAAAEFVRQTLAGELAGTPAPVAAEDYMKASVKGGLLVKFLDLRVLPEWMDVVDDPGRTEWQSTPLCGGYAVDREGVRARRVDLVRDGRLVSLLMSRAPSDKFKESNGHGRIVAGNMARAAISNLIMTARKGQSEKALVDRLLKMARAEGLPYAIIVRHLNEPATGEGGGPRRITMGTGREDPSEAPSRWGLSPALDIVRVDVRTGVETPLRGAIFGPVGVAELRTIVAAGEESAVYSFFIPSDMVGVYQWPQEDTPASIVAPSLLFSQLEVRPTAKKHVPLPFLPNPFFARGAP